jgi:hypothetical protein
MGKEIIDKRTIEKGRTEEHGEGKDPHPAMGKETIGKQTIEKGRIGEQGEGKDPHRQANDRNGGGGEG